ncbi:MAG TPA: amidophosphoribosyltransferase [Gammaproteobacteria bacterium]|nr:amidophosphoribosyltransferase [Gammaproteobacteria bacterium]
MCGIIGVVSHQPVNQVLYDGLLLLQHRGQDAAGIATSSEGRLHIRKAPGLVRDAFQSNHMLRLKGNMGIGHVRYPTAGSSSSAEAQPFYVNSPYGIVLGHNGNLTNSEALKKQLFETDFRHINTSSDSEVLLNVFAHELQKSIKSSHLSPDYIFDAVEAVHRRCQGGYAVITMIVGRGILGFRDPHGIRPVVLGRKETSQGYDYMIASESVALYSNGFERVRDLEPGEAVFIDEEGQLYTRQCAKNPVHVPCIFEYVYFSRPDSIIDNVSVYQARLRMGEKLAEKIQRTFPGHGIDVVIPIPDTSRSSALELAMHLGVKYREGFIKNRYIGRTFIMPGQTLRKKSVRQKLNAIDLEFQDKTVLLVDDSIVRGTTSQQIVQMAREAGAKRVYMASAAPPVKYPNVYGIDMPAAEELIAHGRSVEEICREIDADWLVYQELEDLIASVRSASADITAFETSCFTGEYITGDVNESYLNRLQSVRNDKARVERDAEDNLLEQDSGSDTDTESVS